MKKKWLWIVVLIFCLQSYAPFFLSGGVQVYGQEDPLIWLRTQTLDERLLLMPKTATDEILLRWKMDQSGQYTFTYPFKDGEKIEIGVKKAAAGNQIQITYGIQQYRNNAWRWITKQEVDQGYAEYQFDFQTSQWINKKAEDLIWEGNRKLAFTIQRGMAYTGHLFRVNQREVSFKWDKDHFYVLIKGVPKGQVIPFTLEKPDKTRQALDALANFNQFKTEATHWVQDESYHLIPIPEEKAIKMPGTKPGIQIAFEQPRFWNDTNHAFEFPKPESNPLKDVFVRLNLKEFIGDHSFDLWMYLSQKDGDLIYMDQGKKNKRGKIQYNNRNHQYTIDIVKASEENTTNQEKYIVWEDLQPSTLYRHTMYWPDQHQEKNTGKRYYFATEYLPEKGFAYTYLQYEVKRSSKQDAYLEITPYRGGEDVIEYNIYHDRNRSDQNSKEDILSDKKLVTHYQDPKVQESLITIPIPFEKSHVEYYQVKVGFRGHLIASQIIRYNPMEDTNVAPPVPYIQAIENRSVIPPKKEEDQEPSHIQFDIRWSAPEEKLLKEMMGEGKIYYELWLQDQPTDAPSRLIQIFEVGQKDGKIIISPYSSKEGTSLGTYDNKQKTFVATLPLKRQGTSTETGWIKEWEQNNPLQDGTPYKEKEAIDPLVIPGIYFLKMRAVFVPQDTQNERYPESQFSNAESLSLTVLKHELPIPTGLNYENSLDQSTENTSEVQVKWNKVDPSTYEKYMLTPLGLQIDFNDPETGYTLLIAQDKKKLEKVIKNQDKNQTPIVSENRIITLSKKDLLELREGAEGVITLRHPLLKSKGQETESLMIKGLDPNQVYYIAIQTEVKITDHGETQEIRRSSFSEILQMTTMAKPEVPGDNEKIPVAPKDFHIITQPSNNAVQLGWTIPMISNDPKERVEYEILRIPRKPFSKENDFQKGKIEDIVKKDEKNYKAWKTFNGRLYEYKPSTGKWEEDKNIEKYILQGEQVKFLDSTLAPNEIYYYYLRMVRVPKGEKPEDVSFDVINQSQWVGLSVTTPPIQRPINLRIEPEEAYERDPKTATVISFDAPVPEDQNLKRRYAVQVYVKDDDTDTDYHYWDDAYEIDELDSTLKGYVRYVYRIRGLRPGKGYSIKVRMEDRSQTLEDGTYPTSSFSDRVRTRTEFDQDDYDQDNKYKEYIDFYEKEAQKLKQTPFWVVGDQKQEYQVKYRRDILKGELQTQGKNTYPLVGKEGVRRLVYYFPSGILENMDMEQITFLTQNQGMEVGLRPGMLDYTVKAIKDMAEKMRTHSSYQDYYIQVTLDFKEYKSKVQGITTQSPSVTLSLDVVGSRRTEEKVEKYMVDQLDFLIESYKGVFKAALRKELNRNRGMDEKKLVEIVNNTLEQIKATHARNIGRSFTNYDLKLDRYSIQHPLVPMYLSASISTPKGEIGGYYYYANKIESVSAYAHKNRYILDMHQIGEYFFGTAKVVLPYYPPAGEPDGYQDQKTRMIYEFGLQEFYTRQKIHLPNNRRILLGMTAKVLGAPQGTNYVDWLRQRGIITTTNGTLEGLIPKDEAIFLLSKIYEERTGTSFQSLRIQNYTQIKDLQQAKEPYRKSLLAAAQLNLLPLEEGYFYPNASLTMEETLDILVKILEKTGW